MTHITAFWVGAAVVLAIVADMAISGGAGLFYIARALFGLIEQMRVWD